MYEQLLYDITEIDTGLMGPGHAVCYLLESEGEAAVIETGVAATTQRVLALLDLRGIARHKVQYIIPTHVHLDHAAGAGSLIDALPSAQLIVHPHGARHMINSTKLISGATSVYGEEMFKKIYGKITPIPEERVKIADDNTILKIGVRSLEFRDTPGHANHHFCIWDKISQGWFSDDTLGNGYRELTSPAGPFLFPAAAPVQFDPDSLIRSIKLLMSY